AIEQHVALLALAFAPDGRSFVAGGNDGGIRLWETATRKERRLRAHRPGVFALASSPAGQLLAPARPEDETRRLCATAPRKEVRRIRRHGTGGAHTLSFSPDGKTLALGGDTVQLWDVATGRDIRPFAGHEGAVAAAALAPDGKGVFLAGDDPVIRLWDAATG